MTTSYEPKVIVNSQGRILSALGEIDQILNALSVLEKFEVIDQVDTLDVMFDDGMF